MDENTKEQPRQVILVTALGIRRLELVSVREDELEITETWTLVEDGITQDSVILKRRK
jgi:hypothetical protein